MAKTLERNEAFDIVPRHRARWATSLGGARRSRRSGVVGGGGGGRDSHCYLLVVRFEMIEMFLEKQTTKLIAKINCRRKTSN
jgi:hypothetical protein